MNIKALQDAIRSIWVLPASGLSAANVYFADQDVKSTAPGPCITISLGGPSRIGMLDQVKQSYDSTASAGQEIVLSAMGPREMVCTLQAFSPSADGQGQQGDARQLLSLVEASLGLPTIRPALNRAGLGVLKQGSVVWQPGIQRAGWEGRAVLETTFCVAETVTARLGYIQTVNGTGTVDDEAPVPYTLDVEGD